MKTLRITLFGAAFLGFAPFVFASPGLAPNRAAQGPLADERGAALVAESTEVSAALERGLSSIDVQEIKADLRFISSDEMQGRDTPSEGLRKTARFLRARLERLGFTPSGDNGFFDMYELVSSQLDQEDTHGFIQGDGFEFEFELSFGEDYYFWRDGAVDLDVKGDVVFVGTGSRSDLSRADLSGKWALAYESRPVGDLRKDLVRAGAVGAIIASPPNTDDTHGKDRAAGIARWMSRGGLQIRSGAPFPIAYFSRDALAKLTRGVGGSVTTGQSVGASFRDVRATDTASEPAVLENVAGLWPGSDPVLSKEVIVISAHYDHVGVKGELIYNGADDNGSGTSGLLALAEALVAYGPMQRSVLLLWVSGEEKGLLGSKAWTQAPTLPDGMRAVCNLNIDMIGRNAADYLLITPTKARPEYNGLTRMAERLAPLEGFPELGSCDEYWRRSDHKNFADDLGIPVAFLFSDIHEDYHQPTDTWDKIDFDKIRRVTRLVFRMIDGLQGIDLAQL